MSGYRPPRFSGLGAHVSGVSAWVLMTILEQSRAWDRVQGLPTEHRTEVLRTLDTLKASAIFWSEHAKAEQDPGQRVPEVTPEERPKSALEAHKTVAQTAARLNCSQRRVRQMLKEGKIQGRQVSGMWLVEDQSVEDYLLSRDVA